MAHFTNFGYVYIYSPCSALYRWQLLSRKKKYKISWLLGDCHPVVKILNQSLTCLFPCIVNHKLNGLCNLSWGSSLTIISLTSGRLTVQGFIIPFVNNGSTWNQIVILLFFQGFRKLLQNGWAKIIYLIKSSKTRWTIAQPTHTSLLPKR